MGGGETLPLATDVPVTYHASAEAAGKIDAMLRTTDAVHSPSNSNSSRASSCIFHSQR